jgi:hypothetical protein
MIENSNVLKLQEIANKSPENKKVFEYFASRERDRRDTVIKRLSRVMKEHHTDIGTDSICSLFRDLANLGYGSIVLGRNQRPNRFIWDTRLTQVGRVALGKNAGVEGYKPRNNLRSIAPPKLTERTFMNNVLKKSNDKVTIRKGDIEIDVPANVSPETMEVITHLVDKL